MYHLLLSLLVLAGGNYPAVAVTVINPSSRVRPNCRFDATGLAALELSEGTRVFFPNDGEFANETLRWTTFHAPSYSVTVQPALESDIQRLVRLPVPILAAISICGLHRDARLNKC